LKYDFVPYNTQRTVWYCPVNTTKFVVGNSYDFYNYGVLDGVICDSWDNHTVIGLDPGGVSQLSIGRGDPTSDDDQIAPTFTMIPDGTGLYSKIIIDTIFPVTLANLTGSKYLICYTDDYTTQFNCTAIVDAFIPSSHLYEATCQTPLDYPVNVGAGADFFCLLSGAPFFYDTPIDPMNSFHGTYNEFSHFSSKSITVLNTRFNTLQYAFRVSDYVLRIKYSGAKSHYPVVGNFIIFCGTTYYKADSIHRISNSEFELVLNDTIPLSYTDSHCLYIYPYYKSANVGSNEAVVPPFPVRVQSAAPTGAGSTSLTDLPQGLYA